MIFFCAIFTFSFYLTKRKTSNPNLLHVKQSHRHHIVDEMCQHGQPDVSGFEEHPTKIAAQHKVEQKIPGVDVVGRKEKGRHANRGAWFEIIEQAHLHHATEKNFFTNGRQKGELKYIPAPAPVLPLVHEKMHHILQLLGGRKNPLPPRQNLMQGQ